jgi:ABC-2 type transport system permease protein
VSARGVELVVGPIRSIRRAAILWSLSLAALVAVTISVWPAFRDSSGFGDLIGQLPESVINAFGLQDIETPAGYLRGNLYDFFVPLLLAGASIGFANSLLSSEEDAGRLELTLSGPVTREGVFLGRALAALACTLALTLAVAAAQVVSDAVFDLQIAADRLAATLVLSGLLALFHGGLALAVAGFAARPAAVLGVGLFVAFGGCTAAALLPLTDFHDLVHLVPWDWAFAGDPLTGPTEAWRYLALAIPAVALTGLGAWAFGRRDVSAA